MQITKLFYLHKNVLYVAANNTIEIRMVIIIIPKVEKLSRVHVFVFVVVWVPKIDLELPIKIIYSYRLSIMALIIDMLYE